MWDRYPSHKLLLLTTRCTCRKKSSSVFQEYVQSTMEDVVHDDRLEDMICDVGVKSIEEAQGYKIMSIVEETLLYPGSTNFTLLSAC